MKKITDNFDKFEEKEPWKHFNSSNDANKEKSPTN